MGVKGSNNWVIEGRHSESGGVLMGSDPHLDNGIPTSWHLSEINFFKEGHEQSIVGASMPGMPYIIIGRNKQLAFSVTVLMQDNSDAFLERIDHQSGTYLFNNTWVALKEEKRLFQVKGEQKKRQVIRKSTRKGPLLEKVIGGRSKRTNLIGDDISIAWIGMSPVFDSFKNLMTYSHETTLDGFMKSVAQTKEASLHFLVGSRQGDIAYIPVGGQPIKRFRDGGFYKDGTDPH